MKLSRREYEALVQNQQPTWTTSMPHFTSSNGNWTSTSPMVFAAGPVVPQRFYSTMALPQHDVDYQQEINSARMTVANYIQQRDINQEYQLQLFGQTQMATSTSIGDYPSFRQVGRGISSVGVVGTGGAGGHGGSGPSTSLSNPYANVRAMVAPKATVDLDTITDLSTDVVDDYGAAEMQRSAILSDKLLALIGQDTGGEFTEKLNGLVMIAKGLNPDEAVKRLNIWRRLLALLGAKKETAASQYRMLDAQISTLSGELKVHSDRQDRRKDELEALFQENGNSYTDIETLVAKGRAFLKRVAEAPIAEVKSGMEAQRIADRHALAQRLEKRLTDLDVAMTLMLQTAPEIRIMQANAQALIDKFTTLTHLTIPAWKKQFALHVLQLEQKRSATVADAVDDATNDAFRKNADMLHDNTLQVAKSGQRQIMDLSTVEHVQGEILRTVADVRQLNADATASRAQIAAKLEHIRDDLIASVAGQAAAQIVAPAGPTFVQYFNPPRGGTGIPPQTQEIRK